MALENGRGGTRIPGSGFDHAKRLVEDGRVVLDDRDAWSEHQPSAKEEKERAAAHLHGMLETAGAKR